jgi:2-polyprenyl-3-methyl-5-hydroxy-6-metoxy-1,4-benzoquinol methylase
MLDHLKHINQRRAILRSAIDVTGHFDHWKESCVPSYCHKNFAAAYVSWLRLFKVAEVAKQAVPHYKRVIDFGSSVGELGHLIDQQAAYHFIEQDEAAASFLQAQHPNATRQTLEAAPKRHFDAVFAIDSLEHNENYRQLLTQLFELLAPGGVLVLSGPTENSLYKFGRKLAGFSGDYHVTTIFEIEGAAGTESQCVARTTVPFGAPLFMISAWQPRGASSKTN